MDARLKKGLEAGGRSLSDSGQSMIDSSRDEAASSVRPVQYKRGGKVRNTGVALLHRKERVIPASKRKKVERLMKREGMSLTNRRRSSGRR